MSESRNECVLANSFKYKDILINQNKYLVGVCEISDAWQILLTNLVESYEENLTKDDIIKRCEDLNPFLVDFSYEEVIKDMLNDIPRYTVSCTTECINLEYDIEDGKILFRFNLTKSNPERFYNNSMENLFFSFSEVYHRYTHLLEIVRKKDQEIEEYKAQGLELLRKSLITEPFTETIFESKLKNTKPVDKINVFLNALNFYESVKNVQICNTSIKQEDSAGVKLESQLNEEESEENCINTGKSRKRPSSSDVRCAVAPKFMRKTKANRQNLQFKYL